MCLLPLAIDVNDMSKDKLLCPCGFSGTSDEQHVAQVIGTWLAIRVLGSWFCKHEEEAASISERLFERPDKLEKVRDRLAACGASQVT